MSWLVSLEGVPSAFAATRDGIDALLRDRGLRRTSPEQTATSLLRGAHASAVLEGSTSTFEEVAETLGRTPAATRRLAVRARAHVRIDQPRYTVPREAGEELARAFFHACRTGDASALTGLLSDGATLHSDGGGKVYNALNVIRGADKVVRLFLGLSRKRGATMEYLRFTMIDGLPGFIWRVGDELQTTALEVEDGRGTTIYVTRNPEKLTRIRLH